MPASDHVRLPASVARLADALHALPGVESVALGGSRAQGAATPDSDWDLAVHHRDGFDPQAIRDLGWPAQLTGLGGWGPIFGGGGKLTLDDALVDIHYRDLALLERIHDDALRGEFAIELLLFHQAGIPGYILLAELGMNVTLRGTPPRWEYPPALRESAPRIWRERAEFTLIYAGAHAAAGRTAQCAGLLSEAACQTAHAILARRGTWVTNEKRLLDLAGLRGVDAIIARLALAPATLLTAVEEARALFRDALGDEGGPR